MQWNWQLPNWPKFIYNSENIIQLEKKFLLGAGSSFAFLKNINENDRNQFVVEILSIEGQQSSKIEGEILERESLQSSIRQQFGLKEGLKIKPGKELGMAEVLCSVFNTYDIPLSHEMLWEWQRRLFQGQSNLQDIGKYRTHPEPMQIVSGRMDDRRVFFEAPPSENLRYEMQLFVNWFNEKRTGESILGKAAVAHAYFECIHPFEDGNGRIGRVIVEKVLSQSIGQPVLIAISKWIEKRKKEYYAELGKCNHTLEIQGWVEFFANIILEAQKDSMDLLHFLVKKSKILSAVSKNINPRQEKALLRMFAEGPEGFSGGLSAEKYITISKASRATATRDLNELVNMGVLRKTGELRHTRYWLNLERTF